MVRLSRMLLVTKSPAGDVDQGLRHRTPSGSFAPGI
jgi:hypothetical protein